MSDFGVEEQQMRRHQPVNAAIQPDAQPVVL
jgi:hypothetical protein